MDEKYGVYGLPPAGLAAIPPGAVQFSPLMPGAAALEECVPASLSSISVLAPHGTAERRYTLALALRTLEVGGAWTILAPKDRGGSRLGDELRSFGVTGGEEARRHHRICSGLRPAVLLGMDEALAGGALQWVEDLDQWSQPGVFSWNRADPGSVLLGQHLPALAGNGADFGCGTGFLAKAVLASAKVKDLLMVDIDRRALAACARNVTDPRARTRWADVRSLKTEPSGLDFVVMNPPFHDNGHEDQSLGQEFIRQAASRLRSSGTLWLTANRHLPYEAILKPLFRRVRLIIEAGGFKLFEAQK